MKLLALRGENFRSFAQLELDLNVDGLVAVVGPNGAGKSTIFAAIEWALYGQRGRGSLPVRRDDAPEGADCWVEVEFEVGGRAYLVRRVDGKDAKLIDTATREKLATGREDTGRQVAVLLGLNREMFRGTFYARQKEVQALDSDNDARRREQVELLLGIERLRRAAGHAGTAGKEQERLVEAVEAAAPDVSVLRAQLEQIEREAQAAAPAVQAAEQAVAAAKRHRQEAAAELQRVQALVRERDSREFARREAEAIARREAEAGEALGIQVGEAEAAVHELETLTPAASLVDELAAQEREADQQRGKHEHAERLRGRQREALQSAARLADRVAEIESDIGALLLAAGEIRSDDGEEDPAEHLAGRLDAEQQELDSSRERQATLADRRRETEGQAGELEQLVGRLERAAALDAQLAELENAERDADDAVDRWHSAQAKRAQLEEAIAHDSAHRDAVLAGEAQAACPTCKRPYADGELDTITAQFEADLQAAREALAALEDEITELKRRRTSAQQRAKRRQALVAEREALGTLSPERGLRDVQQELEGCRQRVDALTGEETRCAARVRELAERLPELRKRLRAVREHQRTITEAQAGRAQAEHEAQLFAEELAKVALNGYDPEAHAQLRRALEQARSASHRCAALRAKADGLELLRRRLSEQAQRAAAAAADQKRLAAAAAEVALEDSALEGAHAACEESNRAVDDAHERLMAANRKASADSEAVATSRVQLQEARRQRAALAEHRAELRIRLEVAGALSAYRESVSRRARPQLEQETALLLGQTTRGRYGSVQLSDGYHLEIVDGRRPHPLRRFSGGEQDLAALCLRLALSRMLARQRGAETGFVLLDEVFGSQDGDRRRALLEQLHRLAESEFRQVFVISHTDDVVELCDLNVIVARDDDGVSTATGPQR
ncbi:MAG: AAA family ATPase [Solirubrobacteraceae bacterium]